MMLLVPSRVFASLGARIEDGRISDYCLKSGRFANAVHTDLGGLHMATIATRNIHVGEEILVTYGPDYWLEHNLRRDAQGKDGDFWDLE